MKELQEELRSNVDKRDPVSQSPNPKTEPQHETEEASQSTVYHACASNIEGCQEEGNCFYILMPDDSMTGARINKGDQVYIRRQQNADNGDIVAAVLDDDTVVIRTVAKAGDDVILLPSSNNPAYGPFTIKSKGEGGSIIGVALHVKFAVGDTETLDSGGPA